MSTDQRNEVTSCRHPFGEMSRPNWDSAPREVHI